MANFKTLYNQGINQDVSKENYPNASYFDLSTGRLITDTQLSNGNISTVNGNEKIVPLSLNELTFPSRSQILSDINTDSYDFFTNEFIDDVSDNPSLKTDSIARINAFIDWDNVDPIGSCTINEDIIMFTSMTQDLDITVRYLGIWRITPNKTGNNPNSRFFIGNKAYNIELVYISDIVETEWAGKEIKIEAIGYYETGRIQNIYWVDGVNSLRKLNVVEPEVFIKSSSLLDIIPEANIEPPVFTDINANGNLPVGQVQYAYRYFIPNGQQSFFSLPSPLIHLTNSSEKVGDANRYYKGTEAYDTEIINNNLVTTNTVKNSNKSVTIEIENMDLNYGHIEIVSLHYLNLNSDPVITSIYQGKFSGTSFSFTDSGSTELNTYTLSEYRLFNVDFIPQTIAVKDNILFAGNITEKFYSSEAWEEFDTRAFRYASDGTSRLYDSFSEIDGVAPKDNDNHYRVTGANYNSVGYYINNVLDSTIDLEATQDINADNRFNNFDLMNTQDAADYGYMYQSDGVTVGGEGPNISYKFKTKGLDIFEKNYADDPARGKYHDGFSIYSSDKDEANIAPDDYGSPYNSAYYKQYKRDEVYRYALVVYDLKGIPSKPKWLGDIRTPVFGEDGIGTSSTTNIFEIVTSTIDGSDVVKTTANALGIDFSINFNGSDVENEIQGYSIVRCKRDSQRNNLGQGLLSQLRNNTVAGSAMLDDGGNCKSYNGFLANTNGHWAMPGIVDGNVDVAPWGYSNYNNYEWISPEAVFNTNLAAYPSAFISFRGSLDGMTQEANHNGAYGYALRNDLVTVPTIYNIENPASSCNAEFYWSGAGWIRAGSNRIGPQFFHTFSTIISQVLASSVGGTFHKSSAANIIEGSRMTPGETYFSSATSDIIAWSTSYEGGNMHYLGPSMYFRMTDSVLPSSWASSLDKNYPTLVDYIRPSIPYGGSTSAARDLNTYQYIDNYISVNDHVDGDYFSSHIVNRESSAGSNKVGKTVFGGDTFIGYYQHVRDTLPSEHFGSILYTGVVSFPCESTINTRLRHDSYIPTYSNEFNINMFAEVRPAVGAVGNCNMSDSLIQLEDLNLYNSIFSKEDSSYIIQSIANNENLGREFITKVIASNPKLLGEFIDSWTKFGANEFIDLNTPEGPVSKLVSHKDGLYVFQSDGISRLAVNEKSTIQDQQGQSIVLGTGGVLPYTTYLTKNSGTKHKWSVVSTPETIYYYDSNNNTINYLASNNGSISDIKGLFSSMSELRLEQLNSVDAYYSEKYRECHFAFDFNNPGSNQSRILVLNDKIKSFTAINKFTGGDNKDISDNTVPFMYFPTDSIVMSTPRKSSLIPYSYIYTEDVGDQNVFYNGYNPLKLKLLMNPFKNIVTVFDNLSFASYVSDPDISDFFDKVIHDETITSIRIYNSHQDTGTIDLTVNNNRGKRWIRKLVQKWRYNYIRDSRVSTIRRNKDENRLRDYYFFVDMTFDSEIHTGSFLIGTPRYFEIGSIDSSFRDPRTTEL